MSTCLVSGAFLDSQGNAVGAATIHYVIDNVVLDANGNALCPREVTTVTAGDGTWSFLLPQNTSGVLTLDLAPNISSQTIKYQFSLVIPSAPSSTFASCWVDGANFGGQSTSTPLTFASIAGTLQPAQMVALTGDVTSTVGTAATTVAAIRGTTVSGTTGTGNVVFSASPALTTPSFSSIVNTGTLTLPTATDTLVGRATTDTLTNKTLTSPTVNSGALSGTFSGTPTFSGDATFSGSGTGLTVTNNVSIGGNVTTGGAVTTAGVSQSNISIRASNNGASKWLDFVDTNASPTSKSWLVGSDFSGLGVFEITPSTANGGTTYTSPALKIDSSSTATFGANVNIPNGNTFGVQDTGGTARPVAKITTGNLIQLGDVGGFTSNVTTLYGGGNVVIKTNNTGAPFTALTLGTTGSVGTANNSLDDGNGAMKIVGSFSAAGYDTSTATSGTITCSANKPGLWISGAGGTTLTIKLPSSPIDGQQYWVASQGNFTTITWQDSGGTAGNVIGGQASLGGTSRGQTFVYVNATSRWFSI